jgi:hypothetical protein
MPLDFGIAPRLRVFFGRINGLISPLLRPGGDYKRESM